MLKSRVFSFALPSTIALSFDILERSSYASPTSAPLSPIRSCNGIASVGDLLTISSDSTAGTITYANHATGDSGTVPITVNADCTSDTLSDPCFGLSTVAPLLVTRNTAFLPTFRGTPSSSASFEPALPAQSGNACTPAAMPWASIKPKYQCYNRVKDPVFFHSPAGFSPIPGSRLSH